MTSYAIRFLAVGAANTALTYAAYLFSLMWLPYRPAFLIAFVVGLVFQTAMTIGFTFTRQLTASRVLRYGVYYTLYFVVFASLLDLTVLFVGLPAAAAPLAVLIVATPIHFLVSRVLVLGIQIPAIRIPPPGASPAAQDQVTANAFAASWNNLPGGSVYTREQVTEWFRPLTPEHVRGKTVLELGCGNGSLAVHVLAWEPARFEGVDLGDSVRSAEANMRSTGCKNWLIRRADLTTYESAGFDVVYSIGVLHHLQDPRRGFDAVLRNVKSGGRFHCWVYAKEGNGIVIWLVDPIRRLASGLPWWFTKYCVATPLVTPYFVYAKLLAALPRWSLLKRFPLYHYSLWIAQREFGFFRHVAFDQLVTPRTVYIDRTTVESWLASEPRIDPSSTYVIMRNGNSWKFGGQVKGLTT